MYIDYFMKIQNAYGTKNRREKELAKVNREMSKHFDDTFDTETVLVNDLPMQLMIIKDTDSNVFKKKIKSRHEDKFNLGDYVKWNNQIWLVTLVDVDDKTWNCGYMYLCVIPLRWQNSEGKIIERFAYSEDFTKYSSGVTVNSTIKIGDNQYGLTIPIDDETKKLHRDMRFVIDFDDSEEPDVYELTNRKIYLNNNNYFNRGGIMILTMSYDTFNADEDKHVVMDNGQEVWICNYKDVDTFTSLPPSPSESNEMTDLSAIISGNKNIKVGFPRTYTVNFTDKNDDEVDWNDVDFNWNIACDFDVGLIERTIKENTIKIFIDNENCIDSSFLLQIIVNNSVIEQIKISVVEPM